MPSNPDTRVQELVDRIRSSDEAVSGAAWQSAAPYGAAAVQPLVALMAEEDFELARKGKRALYLVIRRAGRPAAERERKAVERELIQALSTAPDPVRCALVWMLAEIGGASSVGPIAALLTNREVREDARCALIRLPDPAAVKALKMAIPDAPIQFRYALAEAVRARGEKVDGYPSRKMVPTAQTKVAAP